MQRHSQGRKCIRNRQDHCEIVHLDTLNAVMDPDVAARVSCQRAGRTYKYFYNPMWTAYGRRQGPLGTYYYQESGTVRYYWHVFDQVLLRPNLIQTLENEGTTPITELGGESLLRGNGRPNDSRFSDHLPISVSFNITWPRGVFVMQTKNYWGNFRISSELANPVHILKEQASALNEKVGQYVWASVETSAISQKGTRFRSTLAVEVSALDRYRLDIVSIFYRLGEHYPLTLSDDIAHRNNLDFPAESLIEVSCQNEQEFRKELHRILSSQRTTDALSSLLSLSA